MKIKTTLLPLTIVASSAAIVTPLITSCAPSGQVSWVYTDGIYEYTTDKMSEQSQPLTHQQATEVYFKAVEKNRKMLAEDIVWKVSNMASPWIFDYTYLTISLVPLATNVNVTSVKYEGTEGNKRGIVSLDITFDGYAQITTPLYPALDISVYAKGTVEMVDIPFYATYNGDHSKDYMHYWNISTAKAWGSSTVDWLETSNLHFVLMLQSMATDMDFTYDKERLAEENSVGAQLIESIAPMYAHYLHDVGHGTEPTK